MIPYLFFNSRQPARNLIFKNDLFEVLAVCWEIGQSTSIQGFGECHCWLAVSVGRLRLQMFRLLEENEQTGHYRLEQADEFDIHHSSPAVVSKAEPVHQLFNPPDLAQRCVSLQVFSPPLVQVYHYSIEESRRTTARLDYDSRYGGVEPRE